MRRTLTIYPALAFGWVSVATVAKAEDFAKTFAAGTVKSVLVEQEAGPVVIKAVDGPATVNGKKQRYDAACELTATVSASGELKVVNRAPDAAPRARCELSLTIEVPRGTQSYDLNVGAGDIRLERAQGLLTYKVGTGDVHVAGAALSRVEGKSGSGNVSLAGSWDEADLKLGAGDADVSLDKAPTKGHLNLHWGTGHATVRLPKDAKLRSSFKAGLGSMTNEFSEAADAPFKVSAAAGAGDLSIRKL